MANSYLPCKNQSSYHLLSEAFPVCILCLFLYLLAVYHKITIFSWNFMLVYLLHETELLESREGLYCLTYFFIPSTQHKAWYIISEHIK